MQKKKKNIFMKCTGKPKVVFVCVHNSCRSQIAEALGKKLASDVFESYSGGTELKNRINRDAVRLMKDIHSIDMEKEQHPKMIFDIPEPDIVIKMGCNAVCPPVEGSYEEDWGLDDPTGKDDETFIKVINAIEGKIMELKEKISCQ
ncbi:MAG: arsenate reductase ArsC [Synergistaceae bacterium]|nr:arsenate reductase ArsC [Synergistaceae bacterium]